MFDNYGNQHSQVTTPTTPPEKVIRFDKGYLKSLPGILKIVQIICNFIGFICIKVSWAWVSAIAYNMIYWIGNIITAFLLIMYLFHFVEKFDNWPWVKCEFFYCAAMCLAYIVSSIVATVLGEGGYAVGFFGLCALIAYGYDGFLKFKAMRRGLPAQ